MLGPRTKPLTGALLVAVLALSLLPLVLSGCASRSADRPSAGKPLSGDDLQRADQIFAQMRQEHSLLLDAKALDLANELLERYPTYSRNDQVLGLAVISAQRLGDQRQALRFVDEFMKTQPGSPL
ncbi:MAG: hypothetical protein KAI25_13255, partial [Hyphomicrobiaceae bacterium]|nr:hypothetical protein [Hyphomicrobiaceae bacterium]